MRKTLLLIRSCTFVCAFTFTQGVVAAERLTAHIPEGWIMGVDRAVGELKVQEFFPPGTESYWEQKVVYESLTTDTLPKPLEYSQGLADQQAERCEAFNAADVFVGFENQYPTVVSVLECGLAKLTGKPIVTMIKIIQGNTSLYTISRIWRLDPVVVAANTPEQEVISDPMKLMPAGEFAAWSATLRDIVVCDTSLDAHPCGK